MCNSLGIANLEQLREAGPVGAGRVAREHRELPVDVEAVHLVQQQVVAHRLRVQQRALLVDGLKNYYCMYM